MVKSMSSVMAAHPPPNADDYYRIAQAIEFIQAHQQEQPSLSAIAHHLHLSEAHLQRLFSRWVGVSPKRFLQCLTLEYAKRQLTSRPSLGQLSLAAGLSSASRLHDLFVTLEAMTPGEYRAGGAGLTLHYGIHPTSLGDVLIATTPRGVCHLQFLDGPQRTAALPTLQAQWPQATLMADSARSQAVCDRLQQALAGTASVSKPLPLLVQGTNFQIQVWRALLNLPFGDLTTYQAIADAIGNPKAVRAVGSAIGANPVAFFIPCHRVIRSTGALGGYRWGLTRKATLLAWEASHTQDEQE